MSGAGSCTDEWALAAWLALHRLAQRLLLAFVCRHLVLRVEFCII
jgi:hypothetical protein